VFSLAILEVGIRLSRDPITRPQDGDLLKHSGNPGKRSKVLHHMPLPSWEGVRRLSSTDKEEGIKPIKLKYNSIAMRGPEIGPKKGKRILLLGDSTMESDEISYEDTLAVLLSNRLKAKGIEFIQQGYSSWSPVIEFAWLHHYGSNLDLDEVYLFVHESDFVSGCAYSTSDHALRKEYVFDRAGVPQFIPALTPGPLWRGSHLYRHLDANLIQWLKPKLKNQMRLFKEDIPFGHKIQLLWARFSQGIPIYPPDCPPLHANPTALFNKQIKSQYFNFSNRLYVERVMMRLPQAEWDNPLNEAVNDTLSTIRDMKKYLKEKSATLRVFYVPWGFDFGKDEYDEENTFGKGLSFSLSGKDHFEPYLAKKFGKMGIPFKGLEKPLRAYKKKHCPGCQHFFHYKLDGHWKEPVFRALADILASDH